MIFVAAGTTAFDELIRAMDELAPSMADEVVMQIGRGKYIPQYGDYFRFAPSLLPYYNAAAVVVAHGGLGITMELLHLGKPLVSVEDPSQPDRHQREILTVMEREQHLIWCRDLCDLAISLERAQTQLKRYTPPKCEIHLKIANFLGQSKLQQPSLSKNKGRLVK